MSNKDSFQVMEAITAVVLAILMFAAIGCVSDSPVGANRLFSKEHLVARGLSIKWVAPTDGTAYYVEETTAKILETTSLKKGQDYERIMSVPDEQALRQFENIIGLKMEEAKFSLYFVPRAQGVSTD